MHKNEFERSISFDHLILSTTPVSVDSVVSLRSGSVPSPSFRYAQVYIKSSLSEGVRIVVSGFKIEGFLRIISL
jgi:hypothetical protein